MLKAHLHRTDKRQQTSWLKLAVGFRIFWKITHVHTAPTDTDQLYIYKHVQSGENKLQPTPTNTNQRQQR